MAPTSSWCSTTSYRAREIRWVSCLGATKSVASTCINFPETRPAASARRSGAHDARLLVVVNRVEGRGARRPRQDARCRRAAWAAARRCRRHRTCDQRRRWRYPKSDVARRQGRWRGVAYRRRMWARSGTHRIARLAVAAAALARSRQRKASMWDGELPSSHKDDNEDDDDEGLFRPLRRGTGTSVTTAAPLLLASVAAAGVSAKVGWQAASVDRLTARGLRRVRDGDEQRDDDFDGHDGQQRAPVPELSGTLELPVVGRRPAARRLQGPRLRQGHPAVHGAASPRLRTGADEGQGARRGRAVEGRLDEEHRLDLAVDHGRALSQRQQARLQAPARRPGTSPRT